MNCTPVCNNAAVLSASDKEKNMRFLCSILCSKRRCTAQTEHILCSKKGHGQCVWVFFYRSIQRRVKRMALAPCGESCFAREERRPRVKGVFWFLLLKGRLSSHLLCCCSACPHFRVAVAGTGNGSIDAKPTTRVAQQAVQPCLALLYATTPVQYRIVGLAIQSEVLFLRAQYFPILINSRQIYSLSFATRKAKHVISSNKKLQKKSDYYSVKSFVFLVSSFSRTNPRTLDHYTYRQLLYSFYKRIDSRRKTTTTWDDLEEWSRSNVCIWIWMYRKQDLRSD